MRRMFVVIALLASTGCVDIGARFEDNKYVEREEKRFTTTARPDVVLSTFDGSIEIRPSDKQEVAVVIEKRGRDKASLSPMVVNATQEGNKVNVDVTFPRQDGWHIGPSPSAKLIVSLPAASDLVARSHDGSIDVERVAGRVELRSGDGSIRARDLSGEVNVETGDGSIALAGTFGTLRAHTGDGSVNIHAAPGTRTSGNWEITTGDGSITLEVPDGFGGEIDAHTGDGRVRVEDLTISNVTGELRRNDLKGRLGNGGGSVRLRTGDGSITLRRS